MIVALENIRSLYNVGSILRTASFFGIERVLLVGYSGRTKNGVNRLHPGVTKTALGADKDLIIEFLPDSQALISWAKQNNNGLVAIEQSPQSIPLSRWRPEQKSILVFGNEVDGVSPEVLSASKQLVEIPRKGKKTSLNVSIAAGIVLSRVYLPASSVGETRK
jgi:tRNA G18 (ribose-2'-O)-methylase SpoU